jgi:hypothetical protein
MVLSLENASLDLATAGSMRWPPRTSVLSGHRKRSRRQDLHVEPKFNHVPSRNNLCSVVVHDLTESGIGLKAVPGQGAAIDTATASGKLVFGIFAALAEIERELISERTAAALAAGRAHGRKGARPYEMTPAKLQFAVASMGNPDTKVSDLCTELGITVYGHVSLAGELRPAGEKLLAGDSLLFGVGRGRAVRTR